ncbi:MAG: hypothetical protein ACHQ1H_12760 [Nitrososphaerales archaeon]
MPKYKVILSNPGSKWTYGIYVDRIGQPLSKVGMSETTRNISNLDAIAKEIEEQLSSTSSKIVQIEEVD